MFLNILTNNKHMTRHNSLTYDIYTIMITFAVDVFCCSHQLIDLELYEKGER